MNKHASGRRASEKCEKAARSAALGRMPRFYHTIPAIEIGMDGDEFKPSCPEKGHDRSGLRRPDFEEKPSARCEMLCRARDDGAVGGQPVALVGEGRSR